MAYRLIYHPAVLQDDLSPINRDVQRRIYRAIEQRLTIQPLYYGEPLRYRLKGYWKLRVGDYRVLFQVVGQEVWILRIHHRKDVYAVPPQRLLWRP